MIQSKPRLLFGRVRLTVTCFCIRRRSKTRSARADVIVLFMFFTMFLHYKTTILFSKNKYSGQTNTCSNQTNFVISPALSARIEIAKYYCKRFRNENTRKETSNFLAELRDNS